MFNLDKRKRVISLAKKIKKNNDLNKMFSLTQKSLKQNYLLLRFPILGGTFAPKSGLRGLENTTFDQNF